MACTSSAISMTRAEPISRSMGTRSMGAPSTTKCIGASMCVPLCAPSEYLESVKASPLRMSFRNSKVIGASPSYTGVVDGSSVVVTSTQPVDPPPNGVEPEGECGQGQVRANNGRFHDELRNESEQAAQQQRERQARDTDNRFGHGPCLERLLNRHVEKLLDEPEAGIVDV